MADQTKYTSKLKNVRVLVIGGSAGVGFAVSEALIEYGAIVIVSSSNAARVDAAVKSLQKSYPSAQSRISGQTCDLGDYTQIETNLISLFDHATSAKAHKLDHIVFTAGDTLTPGNLSEIDVSSVLSAGSVRFFGPMLLGKIAPAYLAPGPASSITLTTGVVSERPLPNWSVINSFATALQGMTRGFALDLKPVRANLVSLGPVATEMFLAFDEATRRAWDQKLVTGRVARPEDVAEAYLYLIRDENITGAMISTSGGSLLLG